MVGDKLVEQVLLTPILVITSSLGIHALGIQIGHYILWSDVLRLLAQLLSPELIRLCKDGETILAVPGHIALRAFSGMLEEVLEVTRLVEKFIGLIAQLRQGIAQSAGKHQTCHHLEAIFLSVDIALKHSRQGIVAGSNDIFHLVNHAIDSRNVLVLGRHAQSLVDEDAVWIVASKNRQLAVSHSG